MNEINCPKCGTLNHASNKFCTTCGNNLLAVTTLVCQNCGQRNSLQLVYCDNCGTKLVQGSLDEGLPPEIEGGGNIPGPFELPARNPGETGDLDPDNLLEFMRSQPADDSGNPFDLDDLEEVDLPDWMKAESVASQPPAADAEPLSPAEELAELPEPDWVDEGSLEDDELDDDWLSELASDSGTDFAVDGDEEEFDWLSAMPETAEELEAALPDQDSEAEVSEDFDWSVLTPESASRPGDTSSFQEWIKPITGELVDPEAEEELEEVAPEELAAEPLAGGELPDWLQDTDSQEVLLGLEAESAPDLAESAPLLADSDALSFAEVMDEESFPSWIAEHEQDVITGEEESGAEPPETYDSWVLDSSPLAEDAAPEEGEAAAPIEVQDDDAGEEESLDEWLSTVEEEVEDVPTAVSPTFDALDFDWPEEESLPLADELAAEAEPGFTEWLSAIDEEPAEAAPEVPAPAEPVDLEPETVEPTGFTSWLSSPESEAEPEGGAEATAVDPSPEAAPPAEDPSVDAWLNELEAELGEIENPALPAAEEMAQAETLDVADFELEFDPLDAEAELTWLETEEEVAEPHDPDAAAATVEAEFPDWLTDVQTGDKLIVDNTPPWEVEEPIEAVFDVEQPLASEEEALDFLAQVEEMVEPAEPEAARLTETGPLDEANVPDWLEEFEPEAELDFSAVEAEAEAEDLLGDVNDIFADAEKPAELPELAFAGLDDHDDEPVEELALFDEASFALEALAEDDADDPLLSAPDADELLPDWLAADDLAPAEGDAFDLEMGEGEPDFSELFDQDMPMPSLQSLGTLDELDELRIDYDSPFSAEAVLEEDILDLGDDAFVLDAKAAAILADMPPAEEEPLAVEGEGRVDVSDLIPELPKAEIPDWLKELEPDLTQPADQPRTHVGGPLDGLIGVVDIPPVLRGEPAAASPDVQTQPANLAEQQQHATLLQQIARGVPPAAVVQPASQKRFNPWPLVRILLSLLLLGVILTGLLLPGLIPISFGTLPVSNGVSAAHASLSPLSDDIVLVAVDYTPAQAAELDQIAAPLLAELAAGNNQIWVVSQFPTGVPTGNALLDAQPFALDATSLGYIPGKESGVRQLSQCFEANSGPSCPTYFEKLPDGQSFNQVAAILLLTAEREPFQAWVEQVAALHDLPLVVGSSQGLAPIAQPYLASEQLAGLVSGVNEAEAYATGFDSAVEAEPGGQVETQMLARLFAVLALILGGVLGLLPRSRRKTGKKEKAVG